MARIADERSGAAPVDKGHFAFGRNWQRFLATVDEARVRAAEESVRQLLGVSELRGRRFLDAGCGSGLFSLAAHRLDADVTSFDLDAESVACARELRARFAAETERWNIVDGSLTDEAFLRSLGSFDVVYCWGVLHHTGAMWEALQSLLDCVRPGGLLALAIYNDQGLVSRIWSGVKRGYQVMPVPLRMGYVVGIGAGLIFKRFSVTLAASLLRGVTLRNPTVPFRNWAAEGQIRGMHGWYNLVDWTGGWPFEVARPEEVFRFLRDRGFELRELTTSGGHGCNEFVFRRAGRADG